jgi:hypothetical protein
MKLSPPPTPALFEHQLDVIARVHVEYLVAEPQDLRLVGYVAVMARDLYAARGRGPRHGRRIRDCVRV